MMQKHAEQWNTKALYPLSILTAGLIDKLMARKMHQNATIKIFYTKNVLILKKLKPFQKHEYPKKLLKK